MLDFSFLWNGDEIYLTLWWQNSCEQKWMKYLGKVFFTPFSEMGGCKYTIDRGDKGMVLQTQRVYSWRPPRSKGQWMTSLQKWLRKQFSQLLLTSLAQADTVRAMGAQQGMQHRLAKPLLLLVFRDCSSK